MKFGIVVFPGTWSDRDCYYSVHNILGQKAAYVWHKETDLSDYDCIILPGGFSYGDYLRTGAIARFSPVMEAVAAFDKKGKPVIGICNGFQVLCEAHLLPGVLRQNDHLEYRCQWTFLKTENIATVFTHKCRQGQVLKIPISHYEGRYYADDDTLKKLEDAGRVAFRYATPGGEVTREANPNGALNNIAGILNAKGNVLGMMPHPERSCEDVLGSTDGNIIWESIIAGI
ncbi:MAG: phosphoribosylformylglycinamidine synthase subunit PurQ [Chloroflexi bacterium]|nr:phosphoribosylformylglycinamidine synthase subunit PurQ [Chloroflexota bacterium]